MAHYGWLGWYIKLIHRLTAFTYPAPTPQPRLWPDEVQFGLASSTSSQRHIICSTVKVRALLDVWPIIAG